MLLRAGRAIARGEKTLVGPGGGAELDIHFNPKRKKKKKFFVRQLRGGRGKGGIGMPKPICCIPPALKRKPSAKKRLGH